MISIKNLTKIAVDKNLLLGVAKKVLSGENNITKDISIVLVDKKKIQEINKKYRKQDKPTDVLSFEEIDEIFICPEIAGKENLVRVLIHGILHLLGYKHEKKEDALKMQKKEQYYLSKFS